MPASASAFECGPVVDDFNRADSADLGSSWVEADADSGLGGVQTPMVIASDRLTIPTNDYGFATHVAATGNSACADIAVDPSKSSQYAGIGLRTSSPGSVLWVKVQDNDSSGDATFNEVFFRIGHQGSPPNGVFATQTTIPAFTSGQVHVRAVGTVFTFEVNSDADPEPETSITSDILPSSGFTAPNGTAVSLGAYNGSTLDNFSVVADADWDGRQDGNDNCANVVNAGQLDSDADGIGDACDSANDSAARLTGTPAFRGLGKARKGRRAKKRYVFTFQDSLPGLTFRCSLDGGSYEPCASPKVYTGLRPGTHTFSVKSVDANGTESAPQSTSFRIKKPRRR